MRHTPAIFAVLLLIAAAVGCFLGGAEPATPVPSTPDFAATIDAVVARVQATQAASESRPTDNPSTPVIAVIPPTAIPPTDTPPPATAPEQRPVATAVPTPTVTPPPPATAVASPTPTFTPVPTPTPVPTLPPASTPTPAPTPTPQPTPTPVAPELRHLDGKRYMLELINAERASAGLNPVSLGDNIAAQLHAEIALANCFSSHWGIDGLKPYMRYSLAGGYQSNNENWYGNDYCISATDGYRVADDLKVQAEQAMTWWMNSSGHRRNILTPQHKKVNIGIAYDRYNAGMIQHFEGDYVDYDRTPSIANDILSLSGTTKNGVTFREPGDLGVQIFYDPPPHELAVGQVARTYCSDNGRQLAALREPLTGGYYWPTDTYTSTYKPCPNPYDVPVDTPAPRSADEAHQVWQRAYNASQSRVAQTITLPWITASEWTARGASFAVRADISDLLRQRGSGVYSVTVWGKIDGEDAVISDYSVFHGITPPDTYSDDY